MVDKEENELDLQKVYDNASYLPEEYRNRLGEYFDSKGDTVWKLQNFPKYVPRQSITRFLTRHEIFKHVLDVQGSVVEVGVLGGGSLLSWAHLSSIFEYLNYQRRIIGFDVFGDDISPSEKDETGSSLDQYRQGNMGLDSYNDILEGVEVFDMNRFLSSEPKVELIKGLAEASIPRYLEKSPETVVSLLYLDVNLYEPTRAAIEHFFPRMPKGAVIVFDELNDRGLPGETLALIDTIGIRNLSIKRFSHDTKISYAVLD